VIFHRGIHYFKEFSFGTFEILTRDISWGSYLIPIVPGIGGLIVGLVFHFISRESKGHGVPDVMKAVVVNYGIMKPNLVVTKTISSIVSIGSGGAGGREGPIVQIGATFGSLIGQFFKLSPERIRTLVGCGAGGGISAIFNAPLGGVMFAVEIILGEFNLRTFTPIVISSVIATAVSRSILGDNPTFVTPDYSIVSNIEFIFYLILGLICGIASAGFTRIFYWFEDKFDKLARSLPHYLIPAIGGLLTGIVIIFAPDVVGFSYNIINDTILGKGDLNIILLTFLLKPIAVGLTLGSGGSGGTLAPALKTGAMLGAIVGYIFHLLLPNSTADYGAYALVGMGAMLAGTMHAPVTAILMIFEITGGYKIILPIMFASVTSTAVSKFLLKDSIYTFALSKAGIRVAHGVNLNIVTNVRIREIIRTNFERVLPSTTLGELIKIYMKCNYDSIPVVDKDGKFVGIINFNNIKEVVGDHSLYNILVAKDITEGSPLVLKDNDNLGRALRAFEIVNHDIIPVVSSKDGRTVVGILYKDDIFDRYRKEILIQHMEK
jgi:CIC family chloride channel protein